jgi:uncharacterized membrane protein
VDHPVFGNEWMAWNLFLAVFPALLAYKLFRPEAWRGVGWWLGVATFIAFLPNAPYVLTDVVHLPADLRIAGSSGSMTLAVLAFYAGFATIGFGAYAYSILRLLGYMRAQGVGAAGVVVTELSLHCLVTIGVVLGRVFRFNSWDLLARPGEVLDAVHLPQTERGLVAVLLFVATLVVGTLVARLGYAALQRTQRLHSR